jgi:hypothetical protein
MQQARALESGGAGAAGRPAYRILFADVARRRTTCSATLDAMIERLSAEPHLLETLQVYLELRQHRKAVASSTCTRTRSIPAAAHRTLLGGRA